MLVNKNLTAGPQKLPLKNCIFLDVNEFHTSCGRWQRARFLYFFLVRPPMEVQSCFLVVEQGAVADRRDTFLVQQGDGEREVDLVVPAHGVNLTNLVDVVAVLEVGILGEKTNRSQVPAAPVTSSLWQRLHIRRVSLQFGVQSCEINSGLILPLEATGCLAGLLASHERTPCAWDTIFDLT